MTTRRRAHTAAERLAIVETELANVKLRIDDTNRKMDDLSIDVKQTNTQLGVVINQLSGFKGGGYAIATFLGLASAAVAVLAWLGFSGRVP